MPAQNKLLLRGGTLLIHDDSDRVIPTPCDLLVEENIISKIEENIQLSQTEADSTKVLDCRGKIISPGFISTHHHLFQTQSKGRHANHTLIEYMPRGHFTGSLYSLKDLFWGQLGGALESIDAGTTTLVDHSMLNLSPDYPKISIQALVTSGIRCVYCYHCSRKVTSWEPFTFEDDFTSPWVMDTFKALAAAGPFGNGRVHLGYANDNVYLPAEVIKPFYEAIRAAPAKLITTHSLNGPCFGDVPSVVQILNSHSLLGKDILLSHTNLPKPGDDRLFEQTGAWISTTPGTELQMAAPPLALLPEFYKQSSLGIDCHSWGSSYMPNQMMLLLLHARNERGAAFRKEGKWSRHAGPEVGEVFNLATIGGAKAIGMAEEVGRLKVGMKADLIIFDGHTPGMLSAAQEDPVAAIVMHSSIRDVDTVIVDGVIRKQDGKMLDIQVSEAIEGAIESVVQTGTTVSWKEAADELLKSRADLKKQAENIDMRAAEDRIIDAYYMNKKALVEQS